MNANTMEPFRRELTTPEEARPIAETEFELPRGINKVEIRKGFVTVHVHGLKSQVSTEPVRLAVLKAMAEAGISIDFLKFTQSGLSFVAPKSLKTEVERALQAAGAQFSLNRDRCIVLAHAANMRDEEGLIARIVSEVIGTGVEIDHLGDMHDRVLLVMGTEEGERVTERIRERLMGGSE